MDLRRLRYLDTVVDEGGFRAAAARLNLSQPALTRQIQILEREVGTRLLDRDRRGARPTAAGRLLLERSRVLLAEAEFIQRSLRHVRGEDLGAVAVGIFQSMLDDLFPRALLAWRRGWPALDVRVRGFTTEEICDLVARGFLDVGIVSLPVRDPRFDSEYLADEHFVIAMAPGDRLAGSAGLTLAAALDEPVITMPPEFSIRILVERAAAGRGLAVRVRSEIQSLDAIKALVRGGLGRAILPLSSVIKDYRQGHLAIRPIFEPSVLRRIGWIKREGYTVPVATAALIDEMRKVILRLPRPPQPE